MPLNLPIIHSTYVYALIIMHTTEGPVLDRVTIDTFTDEYENVTSDLSNMTC